MRFFTRTITNNKNALVEYCLKALRKTSFLNNGTNVGKENVHLSELQINGSSNCLGGRIRTCDPLVPKHILKEFQMKKGRHN